MTLIRQKMPKLRMRDNIILGSNILWMIMVIFSILPGSGRAQAAGDTLQVVKSTDLYLDMIKKDSNQLMVDLQVYIPSLVLDLRYAGKNNFMKQAVYPADCRTGYLRLPAALALAGAENELKARGLGLKVFDAYRPFGVTQKIWALVRDERYAANPLKGSGHNRGTAIDLTLVDLHTGKELDMPTGFDNFTDTAHQEFMDLPALKMTNRAILKEVMEKYGFAALRTEWWHFSLPDSRDYPLLDLSFKQLRELGRKVRSRQSR